MKLQLVRVSFGLSSLIGSLLFVNPSSLAQVKSDRSLNTQVTTSDNLNFLIKDGIEAGNNLFHSFQEFSIPTNGSAIFANSSQIQNIINRVTGTSPSLLDGLLQANGSANVFLLNPNGIVFGKNASLNIGGSFLASTADSLLFDDGSQFSANPTQTQPLLTVSVPIGLQFGSNPGKIINQSRVTNPNTNIPVGLQLDPDQTLSLVGGEIELDGGLITLPSGQVELASVAGNSLVGFNPNAEGWQLRFDGVQQYQNIELSNLAKVDASGLGGGSIFVQGKNISLIGGSKLVSNTLGAILGNKIVINASESLQVIGDTDIPNLFEPFEQAVGIFVPLRSSISTNTFGLGKAGNIEINTAKLVVRDGGQINASSFLPAIGDGGDLIVNASDSVEILGTATLPEKQGESPFSSPFFPKRFFIEINGASSLGTVTGGIGKAGNIFVNTNSLVVRNGGLITANPFAEGSGGDINVNASSIELNGTSATEVFPSGLFTSGLGSGKAGNLIIKSDRLEILNGARITASTSGTNQGGDLIIEASDSVNIAGQSATGLFLSSLRTQSYSDGNAGNINLATGKLSISDRGQIAVNTLNIGRAGNLNVFADSVVMSDRAVMTAATSDGDGGNIQLQIDDTLLMKQNSLISAEAMNDADGGNIDLKADFIVALPQENNDIIANAFLGNGGKIAITSQGIFGIEAREQNLLTNDLNASSEFSLDGTVTIVTPQIDPNQSLLTLNPELIDVERILGNNFCNVSDNSKFVNTGRGGIPIAPTDTISAEATWQDWRMVKSSSHDTPQTTQSNLSSSIPTQPITLARGWAINSDGQVELTANSVTTNYLPPVFNSPQCHQNHQ